MSPECTGRRQRGYQVAATVFVLYGIVSMTTDVVRLSTTTSPLIRTAGALTTPVIVSGLVRYKDPTLFDDDDVPFDGSTILSPTTRISIASLLRDTADPTTPVSVSTGDVAFLWEIGTAAPNNVVHDLEKCFHRLTLGRPKVASDDDDGGTGTQKGSHWDVDLGRRSGIVKASQEHELLWLDGYSSSADQKDGSRVFVTSPFLEAVAALFPSPQSSSSSPTTTKSLQRRARVYAIWKNTPHRIGDSYRHLVDTGQYGGGPEPEEQNSFMDFVTSDHVLANDYVTRLLTGIPYPHELSTEHVEMAFSLLQTHTITVTNAYQSNLVQTMVHAYGWSSELDEKGVPLPPPSSDPALRCLYPPTSPYVRDPNAPLPPPPPPPTPEQVALQEAIAQRNRWDQQLFELVSAEAGERWKLVTRALTN